jgi:hypothetical protein
MARDVVQNPVLLHAIDGALLVTDRVTGPAVQMTVRPPGRSVGEVAPLDEGYVETPHSEVTGSTGPGGTTADYDD